MFEIALAGAKGCLQATLRYPCRWAMSTAPSPERRGFMFHLEQNIFAWVDALANFHAVWLILGGAFLLATSRAGRQEAVGLLSGTLAVASSRPVISALILCGFLAPVIVSVAFTDQLLNQAFLSLVGIPLGVWLWRGVHQNLDNAEGRVAAAVFVPSIALFFGAVAYVPNL